jgi:hypothetical protein
VELAFVIIIFLGLLLSFVDFAQVIFFKQNFQHSLRETGRFATTGNVLTNSDGTTTQSSFQPGTNISRLESIRQTFFTNCLVQNGNNITWSNVVVVSWPGTNSATQQNPNYGPGIAADYLRVQVIYPIKLICPLSQLFVTYIANGYDPANIRTIYTTVVESVFVNEKFYFNTVSYYANEPMGTLE